MLNKKYAILCFELEGKNYKVKTIKMYSYMNTYKALVSQANMINIGFGRYCQPKQKYKSIT